MCELVNEDCGNGMIDEYEECDGDDLADVTCQSLGFDLGDITCDSICQIDDSECEMEAVCTPACNEAACEICINEACEYACDLNSICNEEGDCVGSACADMDCTEYDDYSHCSTGPDGEAGCYCNEGYTLNQEMFVCVELPPCDDDDVSNEIEDPTPISLPYDEVHYLCTDRMDFFVIELVERSSLTVVLDGFDTSEFDFDIYLFDRPELVEEAVVASSYTENHETFNFVIPATGTYYLGVVPYGMAGAEYHLSACTDGSCGMGGCNPSCDAGQCQICYDGLCMSACGSGESCNDGICVSGCDPPCEGNTPFCNEQAECVGALCADLDCGMYGENIHCDITDDGTPGCYCNDGYMINEYGDGCILAPPCEDDDVSNHIEDPTTVTLPYDEVHTLCNNQLDIFSLELEEGSLLFAMLDGFDEFERDFNLFLLDRPELTDEAVLISSYEYGYESFRIIIPATQTYYLIVSPYYNYGGSEYHLSLRDTCMEDAECGGIPFACVEGECVEHCESNDECFGPFNDCDLEINECIDGECEEDGVPSVPEEAALTIMPMEETYDACSEDHDWFLFQLEAGENFVVDVIFDSYGSELGLELYQEIPGDENPEPVIAAYSWSGNEHLSFMVLESGDYYLDVYGMYGDETRYTITAFRCDVGYHYNENSQECLLNDCGFLACGNLGMLCVESCDGECFICEACPDGEHLDSGECIRNTCTWLSCGDFNRRCRSRGGCDGECAVCGDCMDDTYIESNNHCYPEDAYWGGPCESDADCPGTGTPSVDTFCQATTGGSCIQENGPDWETEGEPCRGDDGSIAWMYDNWDSFDYICRQACVDNTDCRPGYYCDDYYAGDYSGCFPIYDCDYMGCNDPEETLACSFSDDNWGSCYVNYCVEDPCADVEYSTGGCTSVENGYRCECDLGAYWSLEGEACKLYDCGPVELGTWSEPIVLSDEDSCTGTDVFEITDWSTSCTGDSTGGPEMIYSLTVPSGLSLYVQVTSPDFNAVIWVTQDCYDFTGENCLMGAGGWGLPVVLLENNNDDEEIYYLIVESAYVSRCGIFDLTVSVIECGNEIVEYGEGCDDGNRENDDGCDSECMMETGETEPNNSANDAEEIEAYQEILANIDPGDDFDWYVFELTEPGSWTFQTRDPGYGGVDTTMFLCDSGDCDYYGTNLDANDDYNGLWSQITYYFDSAGTYYVVIGSFSDDTGLYVVTMYQ